MKVAVVGAGTMGVWAAWHLARRGVEVRLIDAWTPGHPRSSSGGVTRVIRSVYGRHGIYTDMTCESLEHFGALSTRRGHPFVQTCGSLWMFAESGAGTAEDYVREAVPHLERHGLSITKLDVDDAKRRYPQIRLDDVAAVYHEGSAGRLRAAEICRAVAAEVAEGGGELIRDRATSIEGWLNYLSVNCEAATYEADAVICACGPWHAQLFPELFLNSRVTRQEVYYFGVPSRDPRFSPPAMPVWVEFGARNFYGIPDFDGDGFKIGEDVPHGAAIDPDTADRKADDELLTRSRAHLAHRFPALAGAPLMSARVCQYTETPDSHLVISKHPEIDGLFLAGGGSGHGYKLGPAIGRVLAEAIVDGKPLRPEWDVSRLARLKWSESTTPAFREDSPDD